MNKYIVKYVLPQYLEERHYLTNEKDVTSLIAMILGTSRAEYNMEMDERSYIEIRPTPMHYWEGQ